MLFVTGFFGCAPGHHQEELAGVSVPIPAGMKKISNSSDKIDLGADQKAAQASFRGKISLAEIQRFYLDVLPDSDWEPDAKLGEELGGYAFKRDDQMIAIRIQEGIEGHSTLIVLAKVE